MRPLLNAAIIVAVFAHPCAAAQSASFDCGEASTPVEKIICSDPAVAELDRLLGETYTARRGQLSAKARQRLGDEQKVWLERRLKRCQIPAKGDEVTAELQWQAAPCLYDMYRERLASLGEPQPAPAPAPQFVAEDGFMHPLCLVLAESESPIPLKACNRATDMFQCRLSWMESMLEAILPGRQMVMATAIGSSAR